MTKFISALLISATSLFASYLERPLESPVLRLADTNVYRLSDRAILIASEREVVRGSHFIVDVYLEKQDGHTYKKSLLSFDVEPFSPFVEFQKTYDDFFTLSENIGYEFKVFVLHMPLVYTDSDDD